MAYLAAHILLNTVFSLSTRVAQTRRYDFFLVTGTNYVLALLGAVAWAAWQPAWRIDWTTALLGAVQGVQFAATVVTIYFLLVRTGVGITYALIRLSVVVPTLASILLFGETLHAAAIAGLVMLLVAVPLLSATSSDGRARLRWPIMALTLVTIAITGLGATAAKAFTEWRTEDYRSGYIVCVFAAATVVALVTFAGRSRLQPEILLPRPGIAAEGVLPPRPVSGAKFSPPSRPASGAESSPPPRPVFGERAGVRVLAAMLLNGGVMGVANVAQNLFLLAALRAMPGSLAFPIQTSASVLLVTAAGYFIWHERHGREALLGVALAMAGLVLVNL